MIVASPSLRKARELYPDATLHFLCFTQIRPSVEILDIIPAENIITIDAHSLAALVRDTLLFPWRARRRRIDTVINMEAFVGYSNLLSYLSGACRRVGFHRFNLEGGYTGDLRHTTCSTTRTFMPRTRSSISCTRSTHRLARCRA